MVGMEFPTSVKPCRTGVPARSSVLGAAAAFFLSHHSQYYCPGLEFSGEQFARCSVGLRSCAFVRGRLHSLQAHKHIGETRCVTGKVVRVQAGSGGTHYLDFCDDYRLCSFSVVVFSHDLKNIGDVRQLAGKVVEIRGEV
jgi:hypothetical protein